MIPFGQSGAGHRGALSSFSSFVSVYCDNRDHQARRPQEPGVNTIQDHTLPSPVSQTWFLSAALVAGLLHQDFSSLLKWNQSTPICRVDFLVR